MKTITILFAASIIFISGVDAASVFVQHGPPNTIETHPTLAEANGTGDPAIADLADGEFKAISNGDGEQKFAYAGTFLPLVFTKNTGSPVTIAAGKFYAQFEGTYRLGTKQDGVVSAQSKGVLSVTIGATSYTARGDHIVAINYVDGGIFRTDNNFIPQIETNGATVAVTEASLSGLKMKLNMPELVMNSGDKMTVTFLLETNADGTGTTATSNFYDDSSNSSNEGGYMVLVLPAGINLDNDAGIKLNWVTNAPMPVITNIPSISILLLGPN